MKIEELNLEKNKITKIEGLENLAYLKKLELGRNKLTSVSGLGMLLLKSKANLNRKLREPNPFVFGR